LKWTAHECPIPDGSLQETSPPGAARTHHLPSSPPLTGPSPGQTGIEDVVVSRRSESEFRSLNLCTALAVHLVPNCLYVFPHYGILGSET
ncbi:hypothetical protein T4B_15620, partial [Trichinella pseudospiralis]